MDTDKENQSNVYNENINAVDDIKKYFSSITTVEYESQKNNYSNLENHFLDSNLSNVNICDLFGL